MQVDILDIGSGNIRSVWNWIRQSNISVNVISEPKKMASDVLILPGVGSAGSYMKRLKENNFDDVILEHVEIGKRLIGICLGFQIMMDSSDEGGFVECLGLIPGNVQRLKGNISHNSWESFKLDKTKMNGQSFNSTFKLSKKRKFNGRVFYNHEYGVISNCSSAFSVPISNNLEQYSAFMVKDNLIGMQFHPEKSQISGTDLLNLIL